MRSRLLLLAPSPCSGPVLRLRRRPAGPAHHRRLGAHPDQPVLQGHRRHASRAEAAQARLRGASSSAATSTSPGSRTRSRTSSSEGRGDRALPVRLARRSARRSRRRTRRASRSSPPTSPASPRAPRSSRHVATDNYGGGKQAAQAMIEALGDAGGKVGDPRLQAGRVVHPAGQGLQGGDRRTQHEPAAGGKIEIVAELPGGGAKDQGYKAAEDAAPGPPGPGRHLRHQRPVRPRGPGGPGEGRQGRPGQAHRLRRPAGGQAGDQGGQDLRRPDPVSRTGSAGRRRGDRPLLRRRAGAAARSSSRPACTARPTPLKDPDAEVSRRMQDHRRTTAC